MASMVTSADVASHLLLSEIGQPRMAKADLKKIEVGFREAIGRSVERARKACGWSQKELADAIERATGEPRDLATISRWESGKERPLFDVLWAVVAFRGPFVVALAALSEQIEVETVIRVRRSA